MTYTNDFCSCGSKAFLCFTSVECTSDKCRFYNPAIKVKPVTPKNTGLNYSWIPKKGDKFTLLPWSEESFLFHGEKRYLKDYTKDKGIYLYLVNTGKVLTVREIGDSYIHDDDYEKYAFYVYPIGSDNWFPIMFCKPFY